ncbi:hypothetical protein PC116_g13785 [Phytophthora cactorum]|nr:hypothetical protein PC116_g13785 [Phytophthora cactorum]
MCTELQEACLSILSMPPGMVWERVMASLREAYPEETLSTIPQLPSISIIKYTRTQATGSDAFRAIESIPTRNIAADDPRPFFSLVWSTRLGAGNKDTSDLVTQNSSGCSAVLALRSSLTAPSKWCLARSHSVSL